MFGVCPYPLVVVRKLVVVMRMNSVDGTRLSGSGSDASDICNLAGATDWENIPFDHDETRSQTVVRITVTLALVSLGFAVPMMIASSVLGL